MNSTQPNSKSLPLRKIVISLLFGLLGFLLSPVGIHIHWGEVTINLPWSILFPIIISLAYGWKYALIAGLSGGAFFPFLLWFSNGWSNLGTSICYLIFYIAIGTINTERFSRKVSVKLYRFSYVLLFCAVVFGLYYLFGYSWLVSLNPPFWAPNAFLTFDKALLLGFYYKDMINFVSAVLVAQTLLKLPVFLQLFQLPVLPQSEKNNRIFVITLILTFFIWLVFIGLGKTLLRGETVLQSEHIELALLVIFSGGFIAIELLINYSEKELLTKSELHKSEMRFRKVIEFLPMPISVAEKGGTVLIVNKQFTDTYGYTGEDMSTIEKWYTLAYPNLAYQEQVIALWQSTVAEARAKNQPTKAFEVLVVCKNGAVKTVEITGYLEENLIICLFQDITARKQAELELIKAKEKAEESDLLKTQFLMNMLHEIRTPMNAINGFRGFLEAPNVAEEKRRTFTSIIVNSAVQLHSIVENILTISILETKQEKIVIQEVNVNNLLFELMAIFKMQASKKELLLLAIPGLPDQKSVIFTDKTKLTQILSNLITNAIKFTPKGIIEFGYQLINNKLEFFVKDNGIGISPDMQAKIFDRFVQVETGYLGNYGGNGLGLSISKGFVELLGGKIWVESEPEKGATFYFTIPYQITPPSVSV